MNPQNWKIPMCFSIERSELIEIDNERKSIDRSRYLRSIISSRKTVIDERDIKKLEDLRIKLGYDNHTQVISYLINKEVK